MAQFSKSTQQNFWHVPEDALFARREAAHSAAVTSATLRTEAEALTLDEELELLEHHERRIAFLSRRIGFPEKVASTAVVYLKRFFVDRSIMDHNPSVVALHALYAASKVEEAPIRADTLVSRADKTLNGGGSGEGPSSDGTAVLVSMEAILNGELDFLQALQFQLIVFHPYRSVRIIGQRLAGTLTDEAVLKKVLNRANELCATRALHSDILFALPPAILAAAATIAAVRELAPDNAQEALRAVAGSDDARQTKVANLADRVSAIRKRATNQERLAALEKKRLAVRNELTDPVTQAFRDKEAEQANADDAGRRERLREAVEEREKRTAVLLGLGPSPAEKRSRADADLDGENTNSPVRKRLNLMG